MNTGVDGSAFSIVSTYTSSSFTLTHTVDTANDGITTGLIYQFKWYAVNSHGTSEASEILYVSASDEPA
jgi:hypothetical protein